MRKRMRKKRKVDELPLYQVMSACHASLLICTFAVGCVLLGYLSLEKMQVFKYDDGDIYDCPVNVEELKALQGIDNTRYNKDGQLIHTSNSRDDFFYDSL